MTDKRVVDKNAEGLFFFLTNHITIPMSVIDKSKMPSRAAPGSLNEARDVTFSRFIGTGGICFWASLFKKEGIGANCRVSKADAVSEGAAKQPRAKKNSER